MPYLLEFEFCHRYASLEGGIWIPASSAHAGKTVECRAKVDPGSEFCVFRREVADDLEIELEQGHFLMMDSPGGSVATYGHEVKLQTFDYLFDTTVYFAVNPYFPRNLLGRNGWLTHLKLGIIDYEETIYLNPYNQP